MWDRLEAAQCCHLEVEKKLAEEHSQQRRQRVAERMRRAASGNSFTYSTYSMTTVENAPSSLRP